MSGSNLRLQLTRHIIFCTVLESASISILVIVLKVCCHDVCLSSLSMNKDVMCDLSTTLSKCFTSKDLHTTLLSRHLLILSFYVDVRAKRKEEFVEDLWRHDLLGHVGTDEFLKSNAQSYIYPSLKQNRGDRAATCACYIFCRIGKILIFQFIFPTSNALTLLCYSKIKVHYNGPFLGTFILVILILILDYVLKWQRTIRKYRKVAYTSLIYASGAVARAVIVIVLTVTLVLVGLAHLAFICF